MSTAVAAGGHARDHAGGATRDLIDAHRIARHAVLTNPAAYADDLAAVDADARAIAVYRLAADLKARAAAVAGLPVQGPAEDPFICQACGHVDCRVSHMVFAPAESGGDAVYVGEQCAEAAVAFMEATAIRRSGKVRVDALDGSDMQWLAETAVAR